MADTATELLDPPATDTATDTATDADAVADHDADEVLAADLLVEEVSIDGMCGVY
jgi:mycofactocin precursor